MLKGYCIAHNTVNDAGADEAYRRLVFERNRYGMATDPHHDFDCVSTELKKESP